MSSSALAVCAASGDAAMCFGTPKHFLLRASLECLRCGKMLGAFCQGALVNLVRTVGHSACAL